MTGRHQARFPAADAATTPMPAVTPADAADLEHWEILWRQTHPDARRELWQFPVAPDQVDRPGLIERLYVRLWPGQRKATARMHAEADAYVQAWRSGGTRTERHIRQTMRERGLLLAKRAGRRARRLRTALARGGRA